MTVTLQQAEAWALEQLQGSDSPRIDAQWLLMHVLQCERTRLLSHGDQRLSEAQWQHYQALIVRRQGGEPVAYITGSRGFWSLELKVTAAVLIPRPDTELLVEQVLALADNSQRLTLADLGTGSGAIALALASERPSWRILATDASAAALAVASENARHNELERVEFHHGDWCQALPDGLMLDILVSNPPYIAPHDPHLQQGDLRFEPLSALSAAQDGLRDLRLLTAQAAERLRAGGFLLFEHGYDQGAEVRAMMLRHGFTDVHTLRDAGGQERVTQGRLDSQQDSQQEVTGNE